MQGQGQFNKLRKPQSRLIFKKLYFKMSVDYKTVELNKQMNYYKIKIA